MNVCIMTNKQLLKIAVKNTPGYGVIMSSYKTVVHAVNRVVRVAVSGKKLHL